MHTLRRVVTGTAGAVALLAQSAAAATFYVDPQNGSAGGNGSFAKPWLSLRQVIADNLIETQEWSSYPYAPGATLRPKNTSAPVKAGDTLLLRSGCHDSVVIQRAYNAVPIVIAAQPGHTPVLRNIRFSAASRWVLSGVTMSPEACGVFREVTLVEVASHNWSGPAREITIENCTLFSVQNSSRWTIDDWNNRCCNGINVSGTNVSVRNNYLRNVDFGITVSGDSCLVERNTVENFAGDGLRGLGDDCVFRYNTVMNCYDVNANHDDGFQSWSTDSLGTVGAGSVYRVSLIGNVIINYTDPAQPFRGALQGIGCFDGFYDGWVVENNVILTDHWHGITFLGARNCRLVNNTVCDLNTVEPGPPWISIGSHKTRGQSSTSVVRNNLTTALTIADAPTVTEDHNIIVRTPTDFFVDYPGRDLRLKPGCAAVDSGSSELAPATDIIGTPRPFGARVDVGAYEYTTAAVRSLPCAAIARGLHARLQGRHLVVGGLAGEVADGLAVAVYGADGRRTAQAMVQGGACVLPFASGRRILVLEVGSVGRERLLVVR